MFHFLFVPLTLGITTLIAYMEMKYARTGEEVYLRMTKFWGKLFLINFALGIVTGITLEFSSAPTGQDTPSMSVMCSGLCWPLKPQ